MSTIVHDSSDLILQSDHGSISVSLDVGHVTLTVRNELTDTSITLPMKDAQDLLDSISTMIRRSRS